MPALYASPRKSLSPAEDAATCYHIARQDAGSLVAAGVQLAEAIGVWGAVADFEVVVIRSAHLRHGRFLLNNPIMRLAALPVNANPVLFPSPVQ
jgi:hypothetical protein